MENTVSLVEGMRYAIQDEFKNMKLMYDSKQSEMKGKYYPVNENDKELFRNNNCTILDNAIFRETKVNEQLYVRFIYGGSGRDDEAYDYYEDTSTGTIVIFMDFFRPMILQQPDKVLGYSNYLDALVAIIKLVLIIFNKYQIADIFDKTIQSVNTMLMPYIATVLMVDLFIPLTDNDMSQFKISTIKEWLSKHTPYQVLCGIRD